MMDSFLHLPPSLFKKFFTGKSGVPVVSVIRDSKEEAELMWAVEGEAASAVNLKCIIQPFNAAQNIPFLRKVLVGVEEGSDDWKLVHEHWSILEELVLDQIRLVKRGTSVPLWTPFKASGPSKIFIEDFDAKSSYGIINSDTELIIVPRSVQIAAFVKNLQILPGICDHFASAHFAPGVIKVGEFNVCIRRDEAIPEGFIQIPFYLIDSVFNAKAKQLITCSTATKPPTKNQFTFKVCPEGQESGIAIASDDSLATLTCASGCAVVKSDVERENVHYRPLSQAPLRDSPLFPFLMKSFSVALIEGKVGVGKSVAIKTVIEQLDWSSTFDRTIEYLDLLGKKQLELPASSSVASSLIFLDHFDEFVTGNEGASVEIDHESALLRFKSAVKKITGAIQKYGHGFVLICRSNRVLQKYWRACSFPIDLVFKFEDTQSHDIFTKHLTLNPSFEGILGTHNVIKALQKYILNPIKYAPLYTANGLPLQTGVLLSGPSGSGKSFLAKAFLEAHEITFLACRGPEILDKYVGASEQAIRSLFEQARQKRPCVLFFDEFDSLVPQRGSNQSGVTDRIVNQFLTELDGTGDRSGVFLLACSSRKDLIDKAIMRPGRIDHCIELKLPSTEEIIREIQQLPQLEHKGLITGFLQKTSISWADFRLLSSCTSEEELARLLVKLEIPNTHLNKTKAKKTQRLQLA